MIRTALFAGLAVLLAPVAAAQVAVSGPWVTLGDVAPVTGDAAKVLLAPTPDAGKTLRLEPAFVIEAARRAGVVLAIPLDRPILVNNAASAPVAPSAPVAKVAPVAPKAQSATLGGVPQTAPTAGWVLLLARDVPRGARIAATDVEWAAPPNGARVRYAPEKLDDVVGQESKRFLRSGQAIQTSDVKPPAVVHKGEPVRLVYAAEGLRLTVEGEAQTDAAAGDPVRVLNKYSKRSIDAVATADGDALVSR
ncbi:MAG: flagellar basal body P-ring formation protein FlgA [Alphaproteobacteria bacterium]|nr:flagellar basal body P-ring formation protein FlgA [Alphaproteobacteria bacterium]